MKKPDDYAVNLGTSCEDNTYANMINLRAQKIENIPNRKETPAAKNTQLQVILILAVLLILMFLILVILTSLLFINYKSISEEVSQIKNNDTEIMKSRLSELEKRDAEDSKKMKSKLSELDNRDAEDTKIMKSKLNELENRDTAVNERTLELQRNVENLKKSRSCESDWVEFEGHCYFFSGFELTCAQAEKMCLNRESHLVIINSEAEQNFLQSKTNGRYYWIGMTDVENEGTFKWIDGTGLSYKSWANDQPDDQAGKEDCVHLYTEGKWNDYVCNNTRYAICEKNLI